MNATVGGPASTVEDLHKTGGAFSLPFFVAVSLLSIGAFKTLPHVVRYGPKALLRGLFGGLLLLLLTSSLSSS